MTSQQSAPPAATPPKVEQTAGKYILFGAVAGVATILDQASKIWIQRNVDLYREEIPVIDGFLSIVHAENSGAAFGILNDSPYRMWVFAAFTVLAVGVLFQMLWQLPKEERFQNFALGLITSGAVGNAIDRMDKQSVTDFIKVYTDNASASAWLVDKFGTSQWPSFNIADAAIVIGLGMFLVHFLFLQKDEEVAPAPAEQPVNTDAAAPAPAPAPAAAPAQAPAPAPPDNGPEASPPEDEDDEAPTEMVSPELIEKLRNSQS